MDIGEKIKRLRLQRGLTQEELADRCELSKGFISLLERNLTSPSIATLTDVLECLGTDLAAFFSVQSEEKLVFPEADTYVKADEETLKGSICWLVPTAQKNQMEPILVEMQSGGATEWDNPHEGEEFGYVLSGAITLHVGGKRLKVSTGESFCLHPSAPHHIENAGRRTARFLWVSTPPNF